MPKKVPGLLWVTQGWNGSHRLVGQGRVAWGVAGHPGGCGHAGVEWVKVIVRRNGSCRDRVGHTGGGSW